MRLPAMNQVDSRVGECLSTENFFDQGEVLGIDRLFLHVDRGTLGIDRLCTREIGGGRGNSF